MGQARLSGTPADPSLTAASPAWSATGARRVGGRKRARLVAAAEHYLMMNRIGDDRPCRFDVVAIDGPLPRTTIEWVRDAFDT